MDRAGSQCKPSSMVLRHPGPHLAAVLTALEQRIACSTGETGAMEERRF